MIIVVDSDGLIGAINPTDVHHKITINILQGLNAKKSKLIYPATTLAETVTFLQGRLNSPELASEIIRLIDTNKINVATVDSYILKQATKMMDFRRTKRNTLFDAIVAAVALKYKADAIFSFDKFYKKKGFKLASEITE